MAVSHELELWGLEAGMYCNRPLTILPQTFKEKYVHIL